MRVEDPRRGQALFLSAAIAAGATSAGARAQLLEAAERVRGNPEVALLRLGEADHHGGEDLLAHPALATLVHQGVEVQGGHPNQRLDILPRGHLAPRCCPILEHLEMHGVVLLRVKPHRGPEAIGHGAWRIAHRGPKRRPPGWPRAPWRCCSRETEAEPFLRKLGRVRAGGDDAGGGECDEIFVTAKPPQPHERIPARRSCSEARARQCEGTITVAPAGRDGPSRGARRPLLAGNPTPRGPRARR